MKKVAIWGAPRSGTSWLGQIINSHPNVLFRYQPLFSFSHKGKLGNQSTKDDIDSFFHEIMSSTDDFALMKSSLHSEYPDFQKSECLSHIVFKETRYLNIVRNLLQKTDDIAVVGVVRNPLSVLASWIQAPKEFQNDWSIEEEWRFADKKNKKLPEEFYGFEKWKEAASMFLDFQENYPDRFLMTTYSDLLHRTDSEVRRILDFVQLDFKDQVKDFLLKSKSINSVNPYSVHKIKENDEGWMSILDPSIVETVLRELRGTKLERFIKDGYA